MISTYQIRNVLRVYGNDLRKKTMIHQEIGNEQKQSPDSVSISDEARNKEVLTRISDKIVMQITKNDYSEITK
ncbi:MAG: hypothetical protein JW944_07740 [Deltaproteobacteria bacterium]|nr:hypothetical protein [Deltaproteobacteria bacterium]